MANKVPVKAVIEDSAKVERVWDDNNDFTLKDATRAEYKTLRAQVVDEQSQIEELQRQLSVLSNSCDGKSLRLKAMTTRARTGMRGYFGPDSTEYELAGGTRTSDRKPAGPRKPKPQP